MLTSKRYRAFRDSPVKTCGSWPNSRTPKSIFTREGTRHGRRRAPVLVKLIHLAIVQGGENVSVDDQNGLGGPLQSSNPPAVPRGTSSRR